MMEQNKQEVNQTAAPAKTGKKFRLPLSAYLSYLLVACLLVMGVTFSGYVSSANGSDSARVAKFNVLQSGDAITTTLSAPMAPGESKTWTVTVDNQSETTIDHYIQLEGNGILPLFFVIEGLDTSDVYETYAMGSATGKSGSVAIGGQKTFTFTVFWPNPDLAVTYSHLLSGLHVDDFNAFQQLPGNGTATMEDYLKIVYGGPEYVSPEFAKKVDSIEVTMIAQQAD